MMAGGEEGKWGGSGQAHGGAQHSNSLYAAGTRGAGVQYELQDSPVPSRPGVATGFGGGDVSVQRPSAGGFASLGIVAKGAAIFFMVFFWILTFAILGLSAQTRLLVGGLHNYNAPSTTISAGVPMGALTLGRELCAAAF